MADRGEPAESITSLTEAGKSLRADGYSYILVRSQPRRRAVGIRDPTIYEYCPVAKTNRDDHSAHRFSRDLWHIRSFKVLLITPP